MDEQAREMLDLLATLAPAGRPEADDATWLADFRCRTALLGGTSGAPEPVHAIEHHMVGALPLRLYRPTAGVLPVILHLHGGGAIAGSVDGHDPVLRALAKRSGWAVAAPLYRLAPEHRFPAQIDDAAAALDHVRAHADALAIDATRIVVAGDSIGGTFATALARRRPGLAGQMLFYPNTDLRRDADWPSRKRNDGNVIALVDLERQIDLHLADPAQRDDPEASPILAACEGQPPTLIVTCGADPLADEGIAYAHRLAAAGVVVRHEHLGDMVHAFLQMRGHVAAADRMLDTVRAWLAALP